MHAGAKKSGLFLLQLDSPMDWGGIQVDQVILLFLREDQQRCEMRIYSCLVFMLRRLKAQKKLQDLRDGAALKELLYFIERHG